MHVANTADISKHILMEGGAEGVPQKRYPARKTHKPTNPTSLEGGYTDRKEEQRRGVEGDWQRAPPDKQANVKLN